MSTDPESVPRVDEQLSAWLDDELPAREQELLVTRLLQAPELQARVARFALIGSCLRGGPASSLASELAALHLGERVRGVIEGAPEPTRAADTRRGGRWLPYALAAGLALLAVVLVPLVRMASDPTSVAGQMAASPDPAGAPVKLQSPVAQRVSAVGQASLSPNRLTSYLVYHSEYSGMLSGKVSDSHIVNHRPYAAAVPLANRASVR
ncbi:MAG: sigma-E factor negative regulatory protein [Gammaproteobacteria bacterium]|nr:sigma-E factor negative regulatory protein [Gammaproteobacteria bacterium]